MSRRARSSTAGTAFKVVIAAIVGTAVLAAVGIVVFALFIRSFTDTPEGHRPFEEGEAFAKAHTQSECVDEAFARSRSCWLFRCRVENQIFVDRCVRFAHPSPDLCGDAPAPTMGNVPRTTLWTQRECAQRGYRINTFTCTQILQAAAQSCSERETEHHSQ